MPRIHHQPRRLADARPVVETMVGGDEHAVGTGQRGVQVRHAAHGHAPVREGRRVRGMPGHLGARLLWRCTVPLGSDRTANQQEL